MNTKTVKPRATLGYWFSRVFGWVAFDGCRHRWGPWQYKERFETASGTMFSDRKVSMSQHRYCDYCSKLSVRVVVYRM